MRLWHQKLLNKLPQKQLCGQWRECAALLGNGWKRPHATVNYVFEYPEAYLVAFAYKVYDEMISRGYHPNKEVIKNQLLKRHCNEEITSIIESAFELYNRDIECLYEEHNDNYMIECLNNLKEKGISIDF